MRQKLVLLSISTFLLGINVFAQTVQVIDSETLAPIQLVTIRSSNSDRGAITDSLGRADVSSLKNEQLLIFSHRSYREEKFSFQSLRSMNFLVTLKQSVKRS